MKRKVAVRSAGFSPQYPSKACNTIRSPCTHCSCRNGPVPTGFVARLSALAGSSITASPQAILKGKFPSGAVRVTRTVAGSTASTEAMPWNSTFWALVESGARARSRVKTTSLASKPAPSWKVTPCRRWKT